MTKTLAIVAIFTAAVVAAVFAYASTRPDTFQIQRSTHITAPTERIFPLINDLHSFNRWNPFLDKDPAVRLAYSGADAGKGAAHTWDGNAEVGQGRLEITDASSPSKVNMKLEMIRPMAATNTVVFTMDPVGATTKVTWTMSGPHACMSKVMGLFIDIDRMVGTEFEKGLARLKVLAEKP